MHRSSQAVGFWTQSAILATVLLAANLGFAEDAKTRLREAMRQKIEQLPPDEQAKVIEQYIKGARQVLDRQVTAVLPKNLDTIQPTVVPGRSAMPRVESPAAGEPITIEELNSLYHASNSASPAVRDDVFVRRVYLDLIGHLPAPADIEEFGKDRSRNRKVKLVDRLLSLPQYGQHWGKYWSDVVRYRASNQKLQEVRLYDEVDWLATEFNANRPWSTIVTKILTAEGVDDESPEGFFVACHDGESVELAGEAARIFLGTQVACAQCHDHPYDAWKRGQFHELAAFFGRTSLRNRRDLAETKGRRIVLEVGPVLKPNVQYRMPDLDNPSAPGEIIQPVFLTGQPIPLQTSDAQRRSALATFVTSPSNPTFAKAFVNRMWCELVGYGFVEPIDDLGPTRKVRDEATFQALCDSFVRTGYDVRQLVRTIVLSDAYDRAIGEGTSTELARSPTRLSAADIFANLDWVLGKIDSGAPAILPRKQAGQGRFEQIFGHDPSMPADDVEATVPQALFFMNSPLVESRLSAQSPGTLLNKLLSTQHDDRGIAQMLYLRVLGRQPTRGELAACESYVRSAAERPEAFEDLLWALLNTAEFQHQH